MALRRRRSVRTRRRRVIRRRSGRKIRGVTALKHAYPALSAGVGVYNAYRAYSGAKRARSATRTGTRRVKRRVVRDPSGYTQWERSAFTKKLGRLTQRKINRANTDIFDLIWKRIGRLDVGGQLFAGNWLDATSNPNFVWRPIYLVNLTSGIVGNLAFDPVVQLRRFLNHTQPAYTFMPVQTQTSTGTLANSWQRAVTPNASTVTLSDSSVLKWTEIRADIWGCKDHPVEWEFTLCQLDEDVIPHPGVDLINGTAVNWWDQLASKLIFSPSNRAVPNGVVRNYMKVLDRKSFLMNPTSTTESDVDPHVRSVRLFYRMNRMANFLWENTTNANIFATNEDPANGVKYDPVIYGDQHASVHPRARVYLMITCKNWRDTVTGYDAMNTANTGSFNLSVYNRWIM